MSLKKQYLKSKPLCKVTFTLPRELTNGAESANLVGDFNDWDKTAAPMKRLKSGNFTATIDLPRNHEYQFRYLLDQAVWQNDNAADRYVPNGFGDGENSVAELF
ncbi:MAG: isoamylase early set domain-containing protein [Deltaproteobacteria bacterium]|nr:isoamylase early set domain-containing protein [Deltaproteobacteria bacterium]